MSDQPRTSRKPKRVDRELEEFRSLMTPPSRFEDGFTWAAFFGTLFVAVLMVPGSIYMTLLAGSAIGPAAQWVTLILFIEVARRANKALGNAQVFTLFYLSGAIMVTASQLQGGFHGGMGALWGQFFVQSDAAQAAGVADQIPSWVAPQDPDVLGRRSLLMWEWAGPIALIAFTMVIGRIDNMVLGYGLFRLTSDIERLPFPMAPVAAQGILALSEEQTEDEAGWDSVMPDDDPAPEKRQPAAGSEDRGWRWRVFSIGAVLGLVFGVLYLGLPTVTGALVGTPITVIPIPFIDFTQDTSAWLPAVATGVSLDLGQFILGMVLPFWAMVGTFVGLVVTFVANPFLYEAGVLSSWNQGDAMQATFYKNTVDFYLSFSLGVAGAIAVAGFISVGRALWRARRDARAQAAAGDTVWKELDIPEGRGDIRPWLIGATYLLVTALYLGVSCWLLYITDGGIPLSLVVVMLFYALFYTPIISYVTARLEGIAGEVINVPFVREASFILSGYQGVAVWFLPVPLHNYGSMTVFYRQCELTGTKFRSIWKSELLLTPIILIGSLAFAHFIWRLGPIPGPNYPYAAEWWEVTAEQQALIFSSTLGGFSEFERALSWETMALGAGIGGVCFAGLSWLGAPVFLTYGIVRGLNQTLPYAVIPQFIGALIGRYYFQRKLGLKWRQYIPVVMAGFSCGMGLIGTLSVGLVFLAKSVFKLPY
ncbi:MAG: peptide transporter [Planctomycetota bacterium]